MRYPSPVYSGPPIPIDFSDSSFDEDSSPDNTARYVPVLSIWVSLSFNTSGVIFNSRRRVTSSPSGVGLNQPRLMEPKALFH